jgi:hypothetical protein
MLHAMPPSPFRCASCQVFSSLGTTILFKLIELERVIAETPVTDTERARGQLKLLREYVDALNLMEQFRVRV